jgi:Flp pilus assembly protein TadG
VGIQSRERGQSTVEFALSALVLVLILLGLLDLGRAFYFDVGLFGATREGARQAIWFDASSGINTTLDDADIKSAVDLTLKHSSLPASVLQNPATTCPATADLNANYNPPYVDSAYSPSTPGVPILYICYGNQPGLDFQTAPLDNSYRGMDVNVIVLMNFGFTTALMQGVLGNSVHMAANTHMTVGGF